MEPFLNRRRFLQVTAAGAAGYLTAARNTAVFAAAGPKAKLISPGCRGTKVKIALLFMGQPNNPYWPKPNLDLEKEMKFYRSQFARLKEHFADVEFVLEKLVASPGDVRSVEGTLKRADGVLVIHLTTSTSGVLESILQVGNYTMVFAVPYSGHGWTHFGKLMNQPIGAKMDCILTSDYDQLAAAVSPLRAIHHLKQAKILDLTTSDSRMPADYIRGVREKFGTQIERLALERVLDAYRAVSEEAAEAEAKRWIKRAQKVVEPSYQEVVDSCRLALAFEKLLDEDKATVMTVDCYGTMFEPLCRKYAYPCIGFTRLNDMGLGGICESDLWSAMTHIVFQGLCGRPGFISDPTIDESRNSVILAHCLGTTKMDGPRGPAAPYKLRSIMERREGVVPQVRMRIGQKVTQARLIGTDLMLYFTGRIIDTPVSLSDDRGCRTKITVEGDGDVRKLWRNWAHGLHRVTCYGDVTAQMRTFCRFKQIEMVNEAV